MQKKISIFSFFSGIGILDLAFEKNGYNMDDNFGRAAIVENGSPMFNGQTASGESQIRRWMLESDLSFIICSILHSKVFIN